MILFKTAQGFIFAFGFDMVERRPAPHLISWCDPVSWVWGPTEINLAGTMQMSFDVEPEFVRECSGTIVAYQPGKCIELQYVGTPFVWSIRTLLADKNMSAAA